jgi:hypothetical protein
MADNTSRELTRGSDAVAAEAAGAERWLERTNGGSGVAGVAVIGATGAMLLVAGSAAISVLPVPSLGIPWVGVAAHGTVALVAVTGMVIAARRRRAPVPGLPARPVALPAVSPAPEPATLRRLQVDTRSGRRIIEAERVEWFEASGNYARLHLPGESFLYRLPLSKLEAQLDGTRFLRVHRSTIVNLAAISDVVPRPSGDLDITLASGAQLRVSRRYARSFHAATGRGY